MNFFSHLYLDAYGVNIYICPYRRFDQLWSDLKLPEYKLNKSTAGHCARTGNKIFILFNENHLQPGIIAHECSHATSYLFRDILECEHDNNTEEIYSYTLAWLVEKVNQTINGELITHPEDLYIIEENIDYQI